MNQQTIQLQQPTLNLNSWLELQVYMDSNPRPCHSRQCNAELTLWRNYTNAYCWNCLVGICNRKGLYYLAREIAEGHL